MNYCLILSWCEINISSSGALKQINVEEVIINTNSLEGFGK